MNRFLELVEKLKAQASQLEETQRRVSRTTDAKEVKDKKAKSSFRLPYSSNPRSLSDRWN
jgi:hypothetical protein